MPTRLSLSAVATVDEITKTKFAPGSWTTPLAGITSVRVSRFPLMFYAFRKSRKPTKAAAAASAMYFTRFVCDDKTCSFALVLRDSYEFDNAETVLPSCTCSDAVKSASREPN
jgi:hypothetical protein